MCSNDPKQVDLDLALQKRIEDSDQFGTKRERQLLVCGVLCLSVLGVIAFIITGQVAVVVAMNAPLLAVIGKDYFLR